MAEHQGPDPEAITARATVPSSMRYAGQLPEQLGPDAERPATENMWRNVALTLAVVLAIGLGATAIFWPEQRAPEIAWSPAPVAPTSASPTPRVEPLYAGPPPSGQPMPQGDLTGWRQTFTDDFNGADLSKRWYIYEGQPSGDPGGWFLPSHVSQAGGRLIINGSRENTPNGNIYATGGISNSKSFAQTYGKFSIRFRMDAGYGINYIILLWPTDDEWPPEINIAEDDGLSRDYISSTLHHGTSWNDVERLWHDKRGVDFTQWHTVGLEWTPNKLVMFLDGQVWATTESPAVPDEPMSLALQSQAWFCDGYFSDCPNETTPANVNMEVDWVAIYEPE
jgi:hypothetical protein